MSVGMALLRDPPVEALLCYYEMRADLSPAYSPSSDFVLHLQICKRSLIYPSGIFLWLLSQSEPIIHIYQVGVCLR